VPVASGGSRWNIGFNLLVLAVHVHAPTLATARKPIYPRTPVKNRSLFDAGSGFHGFNGPAFRSQRPLVRRGNHQ
jgi:hypothetical protein